MKVKVKRPFFDENGLHKVAEITEVKVFDENLMDVIEEEKKLIKKAAKKED